jgi:hypothetical protein
VQLDLADRHVGIAPPRPVKRTGRIEIAVRLGVQLARVRFERMRAELLDVDSRRRRETLRPPGRAVVAVRS